MTSKSRESEVEERKVSLMDNRPRSWAKKTTWWLAYPGLCNWLGLFLGRGSEEFPWLEMILM
jgi:hypothetical protein